jgi:hypothetical protein
MAAATGSGTLVVVSGSKVHLLRLVDGGETWSGDAAAHAKRVEGPVVTGMTLYLMADGAVMRLDGAEPERTAGPAGREATLLSAAGR